MIDRGMGCVGNANSYFISKYQIECNLRPGIAWTAETKTDVDDLYRYAEHMQRNYNYHYDNIMFFSQPT